MFGHNIGVGVGVGWMWGCHILMMHHLMHCLSANDSGGVFIVWHGVAHVLVCPWCWACMAWCWVYHGVCPLVNKACHKCTHELLRLILTSYFHLQLLAQIHTGLTHDMTQTLESSTCTL